RKYDCTVEALARSNRIKTTAVVQPGMRLVLPRGRGKAQARTSSAGKAVPGAGSVPSGFVRLYRIATREQLKITLTDKRGRVRPYAVNRLARFLRPRNSTKQRRPEPRLLALLAETAKHFKHRTIQVISGYRPASG